jgi:hypothetical protein
MPSQEKTGKREQGNLGLIPSSGRREGLTVASKFRG